MKNIALALGLLVSLPSFSQSLLDGKTVAKVNLSAFALKGYGVQVERQIAKRFTVAFGYSNIPTSKIAFQSAIEDAVDNPNVQVGNFLLGTSIFTPEVRFYTGKKGALHGFYLAPYGRFGTYNINGPVQYSTPLNGTRTAIFDGKLTSSMGGLMIGSQFTLARNVVLDWWILGASAGGAKGNFVAATTLNPQEQADLKRQLDEINIPFTNIESEVRSTGATVRTTGSMAGVRGLGINIGFRF
ncbi:MAG: hypothetical protein JWQ96_584 [Segetibacter sp.]|nr:hypothetical protein [Segetibacter sp.]